ncbi:MAG: oligosaccharide flippase family protein [Ignavibacteriae bacterium]|nr:oligosaccharide flippase family protein [Ignavibacteria bacterium]MBI3365129.1 oligosaccharide flippase family protein [Ignavibacteriota bacterium]
MEFGKHIGKGVWAFVDKGLPALYGLGFIFLVVRVLPEKEYGAFVLIQTMFVFSTSLGYALALQPLTKFVAESDEYRPYVFASLSIGVMFYLALSLFLIFFKSSLVSLLDPANESNLGSLLAYIPLLFLVAFYRNFAISFLQANYQVQKIFWIDATYFVGVLVLIYAASHLFRFTRAEDLLHVTLIANACSSVLAIVFTHRQVFLKPVINRRAITEIWDYGKYTFGSTVSYNIFSQADVFFVNSFVGLVGVATYNAAKMLTRLYDIQTQVIQMFVIPASSKLYAKQEHQKLRGMTEKSIMFSLIVLLPVAVAMFLAPSHIMSLLYGSRYQEGAVVVRVFAFLAFIVPWNAVSASIIQGTGHVKFGFKVSCILLLLTAISFALFTPWLGIAGAAIAYVVTLFLITIIVVRYVKQIVEFDLRGILVRVADAKDFVYRKIQQWQA